MAEVLFDTICYEYRCVIVIVMLKLPTDPRQILIHSTSNSLHCSLRICFRFILFKYLGIKFNASVFVTN